MLTLTREFIANEDSDTLVLDRRHRARTAELRPVRVFDSFAGRFFAGMTVNTSIDGMCVRLPASIDVRPGRFITLHAVNGGMRLAAGVVRAQTARVVWVGPAADDAESVCVGLELYAAGIAAAA